MISTEQMNSRGVQYSNLDEAAYIDDSDDSGFTAMSCAAMTDIET